jgi:hypothetical protein
MGKWRPRHSERTDLESLSLTPREGYVLSRIDGTTDADELARLTGLSAEELQTILEHLVRAGALEPPPEPSGSSRGEPQTPKVEETPDTAAAPESATHRELFERRLHSLTEDARAKLALVAQDPELTALCFDPVPAVIQRVLENPRTGLVQARLIAAHHRNPVGLDALAARSALLRDAEVQRLLLRNSQSSDPLARRLLTPRRLVEIYNAVQSREVPERHRRTAREVLRARFAAASPDERVGLIVITEGRALSSLVGLALDGRTVALLCAKPMGSALLIENLGRWPASPPLLIAHLLKQPLVRTMPPLRALLKRHPNCPPSTP